MPIWFLLDSQLHLDKLLSVRSFAIHAMLLNFLLIGSGAMEYIHNWAHELEDRASDQAEAALSSPVVSQTQPNAGNDESGQHEHHHDESNCEVHAQLHMAIIAYAWTPLLIWLGIWIAFLTLLAVPLIPRLLPARIDCRGPPWAILFSILGRSWAMSLRCCAH